MVLPGIAEQEVRKAFHSSCSYLFRSNYSANNRTYNYGIEWSHLKLTAHYAHNLWPSFCNCWHRPAGPVQFFALNSPRSYNWLSFGVSWHWAKTYLQGLQYPNHVIVIFVGIVAFAYGNSIQLISPFLHETILTMAEWTKPIEPAYNRLHDTQKMQQLR